MAKRLARPGEKLPFDPLFVVFGQQSFSRCSFHYNPRECTARSWLWVAPSKTKITRCRWNFCRLRNCRSTGKAWGQLKEAEVEAEYCLKRYLTWHLLYRLCEGLVFKNPHEASQEYVLRIQSVGIFFSYSQQCVYNPNVRRAKLADCSVFDLIIVKNWRTCLSRGFWIAFS